MKEELYAYAVARIRTKELGLLTTSFINQLIGAKSYEECLHLLQDKGWRRVEGNVEALLKEQRDQTWELMKELMPDLSVFSVFLIEKDFHNLKAAIKQAYLNKAFPRSFTNDGTLSKTFIQEKIQGREFKALPEWMRLCATEAYETLFRTGDSSLADSLIDQRALQVIYERGKARPEPFIQAYVELKIAMINIRMAMRSAMTHKDAYFLDHTLVRCETLDFESLKNATLKGVEGLSIYLEMTAYKEVCEAMKSSPVAVEKWCDEKLLTFIKGQKTNPFTIAPVIAYFLARENEIKVVRMILAGKSNHLSEEVLKERVRTMYV
ncbi:MAG: V-type ATPase subunit [Cellulosilyticaceae bacterium]